MLYEDFGFRLGLALVLGAVIGLERQLTGHQAGIRINILISLGACMFMLFPMLRETEEVYRIASYIVSGVGFLCSGVIFKEQGNVSGINTAATLWCSAAVGILSSTGEWVFAVTATLVLVFSNLLLRPLAIRIPSLLESEDKEQYYRITVSCKESAGPVVRAMFLTNKVCGGLLLYKLTGGNLSEGRVELAAEFYGTGKSRKTEMEALVQRLMSYEAVTAAQWEKL